jgi:hypothetical protein
MFDRLPTRAIEYVELNSFNEFKSECEMDAKEQSKRIITTRNKLNDVITILSDQDLNRNLFIVRSWILIILVIYILMFTRFYVIVDSFSIHSEPHLIINGTLNIFWSQNMTQSCSQSGECSHDKTLSFVNNTAFYCDTIPTADDITVGYKEGILGASVGLQSFLISWRVPHLGKLQQFLRVILLSCMLYMYIGFSLIDCTIYNFDILQQIGVGVFATLILLVLGAMMYKEMSLTDMNWKLYKSEVDKRWTHILD